MIDKSQLCKEGSSGWAANDKIFRWIFLGVFLGGVLAGVILKIYKMHCCGVIFDEATTVAHFGKNIHSALTSYGNPGNNHVINSILICLAHKYLGFYEHFIRIPSLVFGILLTLSLAYIVYKTINSNIIRVLLFSLVSLNWFVFDLSFLARGYSIALGAIYAGIAVILFLYRKIKSNHWWIPVVAIILMNFLAFGSMLSSVFVLFAVNCVFILFYSPSVSTDNSKKLKPVLLNGFCISLLTSISLYCLYGRLYKDIIKAKDNYTAAGLAAHLKEVLADSMNWHQSGFGTVIYYAFVFLACAGFLFYLYKLSSGTRRVSLKQHFNSGDPGVFVILAVTGVSILSMFIYSAFLNLPPGYMRNGVFLLPLVLISTGIFLDRLWHNLGHKKLYGIAIKISIVVVTGLLLLQNLPSAHAVEVRNWGRQSISGPLLRKLKDISPDKTWYIRLSNETTYNALPLLYYLQFGYKFELTNANDWDVSILYKTEKIPGAVYLDEDYFRKFNCYVMVNPDKAISADDKLVRQCHLSR